jgi:p-cumate 2,3-dioxygenase beta subunit
MSTHLATLLTFLCREAELLDAWQLQEWADLFTEDGEYLVPSTDAPEARPEDSLYLIYDNRHRLGERAKRLLKRSAHAEFPRSRTLHTISNAVVRTVEGESLVAHCAFVVYRSRGDKLDVFPGRSDYDLRLEAEGRLRIRRKRSVLALQTLRPQNQLSIIL